MVRRFFAVGLLDLRLFSLILFAAVQGVLTIALFDAFGKEKLNLPVHRAKIIFRPGRELVI